MRFHICGFDADNGQPIDTTLDAPTRDAAIQLAATKRIVWDTLDEVADAQPILPNLSTAPPLAYRSGPDDPPPPPIPPALVADVPAGPRRSALPIVIALLAVIAVALVVVAVILVNQHRSALAEAQLAATRAAMQARLAAAAAAIETARIEGELKAAQITEAELALDGEAMSVERRTAGGVEVIVIKNDLWKGRELHLLAVQGDGQNLRRVTFDSRDVPTEVYDSGYVTLKRGQSAMYAIQWRGRPYFGVGRSISTLAIQTDYGWTWFDIK